MAMEAYLDQLVWNIHQQYKNSGDRKINGSHVQGAVLYINMIDPHKISIGGGISGAFEFFKSGMFSILEEFSPSFIKNKTIIFESKYKELSSMIGAGILVKQSLKEEL